MDFGNSVQNIKYEQSQARIHKKKLARKRVDEMIANYDPDRSETEYEHDEFEYENSDSASSN